jgi:hypothetical protein
MVATGAVPVSPVVPGAALMDWHRMFGLLLTDFFTGSPFVVELEKDLSLQKQLLDVIILRRGRGRFARRLPDGLDNLAAHNLITFKSHHEALDDWALKELTGHYVNYRKQLSPGQAPLLPEDQFRLYAVCSRYPHNLAGAVPWEELQPGVYRCRRGTDVVRVVVAGQLPRAEHNALLHLLSASGEQLGYGAGHYRPQSRETSTLLYQLFEGYQQEGIAMPYTMEDFKRDFLKEHFKDFFKDLTPAQRREALQDLPAEELLGALTPEQRLEGLSAEEIERLLEKRRAERPSRSRKPRRRKP